MRIHDIELYTSKQILAFIEYLEVVAKERADQEKQQAVWANQAIGPCALTSPAHASTDDQKP